MLALGLFIRCLYMILPLPISLFFQIWIICSTIGASFLSHIKSKPWYNFVMGMILLGDSGFVLYHAFYSHVEYLTILLGCFVQFGISLYKDLSQQIKNQVPHKCCSYKIVFDIISLILQYGVTLGMYEFIEPYNSTLEYGIKGSWCLQSWTIGYLFQLTSPLLIVEDLLHNSNKDTHKFLRIMEGFIYIGHLAIVGCILWMISFEYSDITYIWTASTWGILMFLSIILESGFLIFTTVSVFIE